MRTYDERDSKLIEKNQEKDQKEYDEAKKNFAKPVNIIDRIAQDLEGMKEFDFISSKDEDCLEGYRDKRFIMLDNNYFSEYINEVKRGETFYISYLNEEDIRNGIYPSYFSALIKDNAMPVEEFAPRILNYFGVNTVFNKGFIGEDASLYLVSLDCIEPNHKILPFSVKSCFYDKDKSEIEAVLMNVENDLKNLILNLRYKDDENVKDIECDFEQIKKECIKAYIVRELILNDIDFRDSYNFALVYDELKNKIESTINFDFECILYKIKPFSEEYNKETIKNLKFIKANYSDVYDDIKNKFEEFVKKGNGKQDTIYKEMIFKSTSNKNYIDRLEFYISSLKRWFNIVEQEFQLSINTKG